MTRLSFALTCCLLLAGAVGLSCSDNSSVVSTTDGGGNAGTSGGNAGTSGGNAGTSGGNAGTSGGNAGTSGGNAGTAGGNAGAGGATTPMTCAVVPAQCSDGKDNDGDGKVDGADTECVGPCDNDEGTYATGIPGDNVDACKQDCFFDGDSGMGNDGCEWNLKCDMANPGANLAKACPYDANYRNCPEKQSQKCIDNCRVLTPNGCDCFGCCTVMANGAPVNVLLTPTCTGGAFDDPAKCPRCTPNPSCQNTCEKCEVCIGKPAPDPSCPSNPNPGGAAGAGGSTGAGGAGGAGGASGTPEPACAEGVTSCGPGGDVPVDGCGASSFCNTGCCVRLIQ